MQERNRSGPRENDCGTVLFRLEALNGFHHEGISQLIRD
jgi:hypothetical protein